MQLVVHVVRQHEIEPAELVVGNNRRDGPEKGGPDG